MRTFMTSSVILTLCASSAYAGFFGSEMQADWRFPDFDTTFKPFNFIVSDDVEIPSHTIPNAPGLSIDVSDQSIFFQHEDCKACHWQDTEFNGWVFSDINNTIPRIIGVTFKDSGNLEGLEHSDLGFDNNSVWVNLADVRVTSGDSYFIRLNVEFIPAPSALALFGVAGLASKRKRRM